MKITKKLLRNKHKAAIKENTKEKKVKSFKSWLNDTGQEIVAHYKDKSEDGLEFSDEALKLLEDFI